MSHTVAKFLSNLRKTNICILMDSIMNVSVISLIVSQLNSKAQNESNRLEKIIIKQIHGHVFGGFHKVMVVIESDNISKIDVSTKTNSFRDNKEHAN